jgi:hypothetical protein
MFADAMNDSESTRQPRTVVGEWLHAAVSGGESYEHRQALSRQLNAGQQSGINVDELAVVAIACHLALRRLLGASPSEADIASAVEDALAQVDPSLFPSAQDSQRILTALLHDHPSPNGIPLLEKSGLHGLMFVFAAKRLCLNGDDLLDLIREVEENAAARGFRPPLAFSASW